jgi:nucleoside-diphosphate-sugar epimerase
MNVLFLGATGIVGSQVVPLLKAHVNLTLAAFGGGEFEGQPVSHIDLSNWGMTEALVKAGSADGKPFDAIVNCAVATHRVDRSTPDKVHQYFEQCIEVNARGAYHVYEAADRANVPRVVYISSLTAVLGPPVYEYLDENTHDRPRDVYSASKVFGEHVGRFYAYRNNESGQAMKVLCLRLGQPYKSFKPWDDNWHQRGSRGIISHAEDIAEAIRCSLHTNVQYGVYPILSDSDSQYADPEMYAELGFKSAWKFTAQGLVHIGRDEPTDREQ